MLRYSTYPICRTCKFYKKGTCKQYGFKNVETGEVIHELASSCRSDKFSCGKEGKNFEYDPHYQFNAFKEKIETAFPYLIIGSLAYTYLIHKITQA